MIIVSMCTFNYHKWLHIFCSSIRYYNPNIEAVIYLINYSDKHFDLIKNAFPNITFKKYKGEFEKRGDAFIVTPLKGKFIKECIEEYNRNVLWVDITALIRTNLDDVSILLEASNVVLIRRNRKGSMKTKFCAEIFGINRNSDEHIDKYFNACNNNDDWFSDQLALHDIDFGIVGDLQFGQFCNFFYEKTARTWSDRGIKGFGTVTEGDKLFEFEKFMQECERIIPNYFEEYLKFNSIIGINRKKLMLFIDDVRWCFHTSGHQIAEKLKYDFDIAIVTKIEQMPDLVKTWQGDLVWCRCSARRSEKLWRVRPDLKNKSICTITTGGLLMENRVESHRQASVGNPAVITQNYTTQQYLKEKCPDQIVAFIPNGVDINRFNMSKKHKGKDIVVGFAGRHDCGFADAQKGYTDFFIIPTRKLKLRTLVADNTENFIPHTEMHNFYNAIDVLVQVSDSEGCSNTIQEAMASGVPCVISKVGYHGEICKHNYEVVFVERNVNSVVDALKRLQNEKYRITIGRNARAFAERHSLHNAAGQFKKLFLSILKQ